MPGPSRSRPANRRISSDGRRSSARPRKSGGTVLASLLGFGAAVSVGAIALHFGGCGTADDPPGKSSDDGLPRTTAVPAPPPTSNATSAPAPSSSAKVVEPVADAGPTRTAEGKEVPWDG